MDYLKAATVAVAGIVLYYAILTQYSSGTANFFGLVYVLLSIRTYQALDRIWPKSPGNPI